MGPISVRLWEFSAERIGLESCVRSSLKALQAADRLRKRSSSSEQPHVGTGACVKGNFPGMKEGMNTTRIPSKRPKLASVKDTDHGRAFWLFLAATCYNQGFELWPALDT